MTHTVSESEAITVPPYIERTVPTTLRVAARLIDRYGWVRFTGHAAPDEKRLDVASAIAIACGLDVNDWPQTRADGPQREQYWAAELAVVAFLLECGYALELGMTPVELAEHTAFWEADHCSDGAQAVAKLNAVADRVAREQAAQVAG